MAIQLLLRLIKPGYETGYETLDIGGMKPGMEPPLLETGIEPGMKPGN